MSDQDPVPHVGTQGRQPVFRRARQLVRPSAGRRRSVWIAGILVLAAVVAGVALTPSTYSGFSAVIGDSANTASTAPNFSPSGGVLPFDDSFAGSDLGWNTYGGTWTTAASASGATYTDSAGGAAGDKAVSGQTSWTDYTLQGDVKILTGTQAGMLFRVQNPATGVDAFTGYSLSIATLTGGSTMTLGRERGGYAALKSVSYTPSTGVWYHLTVQAVGCTFTASVAQVGGLLITTPTTLTYTDTGCLTSGAIGVRDLNSTASFRNLTATAGGTTSATVATYLAPFANTLTPTSGQTTYGGTWTASSTSETYSNSTGGQGEKSIMGVSTWGDYSLTGDVQLNSAATATTSAGFVVRASGAATGANSFTGYYAGVSSTALSLTRSTGTTATILASVPLPATLATGTWYHLTVEAVGCTITATAQLKTGSTLTIAASTDTASCALLGSVGVRTVGTTATWRDIAVTPR